jgi:hypothetical protein
MGQFLQWNPNETNQETDAQYLADSQRASGAVNDTPLPAPLGNKAFYQWSTFCAAFGQMMANKPGAYVLDDSSESALAAVLANILTESDTEPNIISVMYSPTPVFNAADSNGFQMTLAGNVTSSTISGVTAGQLIAFYFAQDSVGGRTVSWPSSFVGALQPDPTPYAVSVMLFRADLTGNPRAVSPMISNNYLFGNTPPTGDNSTKIATTAFVSNAGLTCSRSNKIGIYSPGVTYTNSSRSAVYEEVTMVGPENDNTGRSYSIRSIINGYLGPIDSIENYSYGYASIGFWVPAGATFSVTLTQDTGGIVSPPPSIYVWTEVSF